MSKFKIGDKVKVHDRKMKVHTFSGEITGIEPNTETPVYNVLIKLKDKNNKLTGQIKNVNLLENQIAKEILDD